MGSGETTITVRLWAIITVVIGIFGFVMMSMLNHESRLTKIETKFNYISEALTELKDVTRDIRDDQIRRYQKEVRESKTK